MTVIDTRSSFEPDPSDDPTDTPESRRQTEAAEARIRERTASREANTRALAGPSGILRADTQERIGKRKARLDRYLAAAADSPATPPVTSDMVLEAIINTVDYIGVRYLDEGVRAARAVGRIVVVGEGRLQRSMGTGFLVTPDLLLTNHHVLPDAEVAGRSVVEFNYQDTVDGVSADPYPVTLDPTRLYISDQELDFALVAIGSSETDVVATQFGHLELIEAEGKIIVGEFVTIVQHPQGKKKQIALRENRLVDVPEKFLHYSADTEPGSSGSPVFNDQWEVVALHHAGVRAPDHTEFGGIVNEGVRVSRILAHLETLTLPPGPRNLLGELISPDGVERPKTHAVPTVTPAVTGTETVTIHPDYSARAGYDPNFLTVPVPLPTALGALHGALSDELAYHHFSVVVHKFRRLAAFTAVNIDGRLARPLRREPDRWILDPRLPADQQTGEAVYRDNPLDRGHLVRRLDPAWGELAKAANDDTFHFTNCTPQHHDFNAGDTLWLGLENYVLRNADTMDLRVSVLTGPVLAADDPEYREVRLPRQFWKVVSIVGAEGDLVSTGYLLSQEALLGEFEASPESFGFGAYRTFQVRVDRIADLTGLRLEQHIAADPLARFESSGIPRELIRYKDIVL